jgi:hypothetical protein
MNSRLKYFVFRYFLSFLNDTFFSAFMRAINSVRFNAPILSNIFVSRNSFNYKLNRLKALPETVQLSSYADKLQFRSIVESRVGSRYLVPLWTSFQSLDEFNLSDSWFPCVVKMNKGSGMNMFLEYSSSVDIDAIKRNLGFWTYVNPYFYTRERHYSDIKPVFLIEKSLGKAIDDFKVFCDSGKAKLIQVDHDRFSNHTRSFYEVDWNLSTVLMNYKPIPFEVARPICLEEMIVVAEKLAYGFTFARVDFYVVDGNLYVGEITFFPEGGQGVFFKPSDDIFFGKLINSDKLLY